MSDRYIMWTHKREMLLGAHLMNDPNFKLTSSDKVKFDSDKSEIEPNCLVQPLLEIITVKDIEIDEKLLLSYNLNSS